MSLAHYETTRYVVRYQDSGNIYPALMKQTVQLLVDHTPCTMQTEVEDSSTCYQAILHVGDDWYLKCNGGVPSGESNKYLGVGMGRMNGGSFSQFMGGGGTCNADNPTTAYCALRVANGGDAWRLIVETGNTMSANKGHASMMKLRGSLAGSLVAAEAGSDASWGMAGSVFDTTGTLAYAVGLATSLSSSYPMQYAFPGGTDVLFPVMLAVGGGHIRPGFITINGKTTYGSSAVQRGAVGAMEEYAVGDDRYVNLGSYSILSV